MGGLIKKRREIFFNNNGDAIPCVNATLGPSDFVSFNTVRRAPLRTLEVELTPIQDLNGYDAPWPAGARNRFDASTVPDENKYIAAGTGVATAPSGAGLIWRYSDYIPVTPGEVLYFGEVNTTASSAGSAFYNSSKTYISGFTATQLKNASNVWTVPENAAYLRHSFQINDGYNPDWATTVYITLNSLTHQWYPYENFCPISGHAGVMAYLRGKNILSVRDVSVSNQTYKRIDNLKIPAGTYVLSGVLDAGSSTARVSFRTSTPKAVQLPYVENGRGSVSVTLTEDCKTVFFYPTNGTSGAGSREFSDLMLEFGSEVTAFEPYKGTTIDTAFYEEAGTDIAPYLERQSAGGNREFDTLVGGTMAWNQVIQNGNFADDSVWLPAGGTFSVSDNIGTLSIPILESTGARRIGQLFSPILDHKYIVHFDFKASVSDKDIWCYAGSSQSVFTRVTVKSIADTWQNFSAIMMAKKTGTGEVVVFGNQQVAPVAWDLQYKNVYMCDLTQMFGSDVADRAYTMEQSTAGSGIAWLKSYGFFQEDYYPYNDGELMSVKTSAHVMRDANGNIIGNYALDSDLELCGVPKLGTNNSLYYDGDTYENNGVVTRKYKKVQGDTYDCTGPSRTANNVWAVSVKYGSASANSAKTPPMCDVLATYPNLEYRSMVNDGVVKAANANFIGIIVLTDATSGLSASSTSNEVLTAFENYLNSRNATFVYELATYTTETADAFTYNQAVDKNGTEQYVDERTIPIPVGHQTQYFRSDYIGVVYPDAPGVVYGAILDDANNTLTVDSFFVELDGSEDEGWTMHTSGVFWVADILPGTQENSLPNDRRFMCNKYSVATSISSSSQMSQRPNFSICNQSGTFNKRLWIKDSTFTTLEAFKTALASSPIQYLTPYKDGNEVVYQLSQEQVNSIKGINNIWSNAGQVKVTYRTN